MHKERIAVVGIGCRFPGGANDPVSFWQNLMDGRDAITPIPEDRWNTDQFYGGEKIHPSKSRSKWGGFVDGIRQFDAKFFGISSKEAEAMDPQQRMLLETAWHALEDAGTSLKGRNPVGVFVGAGNYEFALAQYGVVEPIKTNPYSATGSVLSLMSNRISHFLNLTGPSMTVDTACSASLHALHLACQAIWNQECAMALAGGVNCLIYPSGFISFSNFGGLAADGRCKAFDASADGFVKAEGAGMVLLKPLSRALADKDRIYACIHASRANQDGHTPVLAAPSALSQEELICTTLAQAGVRPEAVQYVEAHGTGTAIGDPVEAHAVGRSIGRHKSAEAPCYIGSVKTNIGHLETASGVAGLIKNALICYHGIIPKNLHFNTPNPDIEFDRYHIRVPGENIPLPSRETPDNCFLGLNSFGFGGANAFILMSPSEKGMDTGQDRHGEEADNLLARYMLPVSARSEHAFKKGLEQIETLVEQAETARDLHQICAFSALRRTHHSQFRSLVTGGNQEALRRKIQELLSASHKLNKPVSGKVAFVFSGQGPQWYAMGRALYREEKVFRQTLEEAHEAVKAIGGWHLLDHFLADESLTKIAQTSYAQPLITAVQLGLDRLWRSWGITPSAVVGHSIGEVAAGVSAGCFDLAQGMRIIYHRGRTMDRASSKGAMLAAGISMEKAEELARPHGEAVCLAAVNGPSSVTFAGKRENLEQIEARLIEMERFNRFLHVDYAFHSSFMEPVKSDLLTSLGRISCKAPQLPLWSTVFGKQVKAAVHEAEYWWQNVRQTVLFGPAIQEMLSDYSLFLEISAHPVLAASVKQCMKTARVSGKCIQSLNRKIPDAQAMADALDELYKAGADLDWTATVVSGPVPHMEFLPYAWEKKEYWKESRVTEQNRLAKVDDILLGRQFDFFDIPTWSNQLDLKVQSFLGDHKVKQHVLFPAAGFIDIFCSAARICLGDGFELEDFAILSSVVLNTNDVKNIRCSFDPLTRQLTLKVSGDTDPRTWDVCATAKAYPCQTSLSQVLDIEAFTRAGCLHKDKASFYRRAAREGLNYGPHFQTLTQYWTLENEFLGKICLPPEDPNLFDNTHISPTILDGVFQLVAAEMNRTEAGLKLYLPVGFDSLVLARTRGESLWARIRIVEHTPEQIRADMDLFDPAGHQKGHVRNFVCKAVSSREKKSSRWDEEVIVETWMPKPLDWSLLPAAIPDPGPEGWKRIHQAAQNEFQANLASRVVVKQEFFQHTNKLMIRFFLDAVLELLPGLEPGMPLDLPVLVGQSRDPEKQIKYVGLLLSHMEGLGYARMGDDGQFCLARAAMEIGSVETLMDGCVLENPSGIYDINMIHERGRHLGAMFRGEYDPLEMIAGKDRSDYARYLYSHSAGYHGNNQVVLAVLQEMVDAIPEDRPFRVLEIGSGMGGMTSHMVDIFKNRPCEFYYTDIAQSLVKQGRKLFKPYDFLTYEVLDIETDPEEQGFDLRTFDLVTGLDVLHAVRDIDKALAHVADLLKPGGTFLLSDITGKQLIFDFLFGPIDGWWRFEDRHRTHSPLMDQSQWQTALEANGFEGVTTVSDSNGMVHTNFIAHKKPGSKERFAKELPDTLAGKWLWVGDAPFPDIPELDHTDPDAVSDLNLDGITGVVYAGALGLEALSCLPLNSEGQRAISDLLFTHMICLVRRLAVAETRLFVLTQGAFSLPKDPDEVCLLQAGMEGLVQVLYNEMPGLRVKLIDLDPAVEMKEQRPELIRELSALKDDEDVVAFRRGQRLVKRCEFLSSARAGSTSYSGILKNPETAGVVLTVGAPGTLDGLCLETMETRPPGPGEVEIRVESAGINFRDLLKVLGVYPTEASDSRLLGDECAGVVTRVGENVTALAKGDRVATIGLGCFKTHMVLAQERLIPLPDSMDLDLAAASLTNYMTVYYALVLKADIQPGERVLVHSAAGGVGMAAIQIAKQKGAKVYATAGTGFKQTLLRALGADHVYDSRSLDFARGVMADTHGQGIDIVLNSLAGPFIEKSMNLLRDYGRFLELGKRDIYDKTHISLYPFRKNISYFAIDMAEMFSPQSVMGPVVIQELGRLFRENAVGRHCYSLFPMSGFKDAFTHMSKALHFGKVVLKPFWGRLGAPVFHQTPAVDIRGDKTYLITGGARGLGLILAQWLVEKGARNLVLVNRSGKAHPETQAAIQALGRNARVQIFKTDVGRQKQVQDLIQTMEDDWPPLDGVFHCAVVLRDNEVKDLTPGQVHEVLAPKAFGGIHLHEATAHLDLSIFMLMGSMASLMGNVGQANYAAANSILRAIAALRQQKGLAAQYVDWGLFHESGLVARDKDLLERVQKFGWQGLSNSDFTGFLDRILGCSYVNWGIPGKGFDELLKRGAAKAPRWAGITARIATGQKTASTALGSDFNAMAREERLPGMIALVKQTIANLLDLPPEDIEETDKLADLGIDSLNGIELLTQFENALGASVSPTSLVQAPDIGLISQRLLTILNLAFDPPEAKGRDAAVKNKGTDQGPDPELIRVKKRVDALVDMPEKIRETGKTPVVFLTGATGLLGSHLFRDLLEQTHAHVWVLVRPKAENKSLQDRLETTFDRFGLDIDLGAYQDRYTLFSGDLTLPGLGLSDRDWAFIRDQATTVIHSAAQVHHLKPYALLKKANVEGTLEILRLCCEGEEKIPLHFVSAIGIMVTDVNTPRDLTEDDMPERLSELKNGYLMSKWVAEFAVRQMEKKGLVCNIYRPGLIFSKESMITLAGDFLWRIFRTSLIMGHYPDASVNLLLAPVDRVNGVILAGVKTGAQGQTFHLCETRMRFKELSVQAKSLGYHLEPVTPSRWHDLSLELFEKSPKTHPLADYLNAYDVRVVRLMTLMSEHAFKLSCDKTCDHLAKMDFPPLEVDGSVLKGCITALQNAGMIPLPGERA